MKETKITKSHNKDVVSYELAPNFDLKNLEFKDLRDSLLSPTVDSVEILTDLTQEAFKEIADRLRHKKNNFKLEIIDNVFCPEKIKILEEILDNPCVTAANFSNNHFKLKKTVISFGTLLGENTGIKELTLYQNKFWIKDANKHFLDNFSKNESLSSLELSLNRILKGSFSFIKNPSLKKFILNDTGILAYAIEDLGNALKQSTIQHFGFCKTKTFLAEYTQNRYFAFVDCLKDMEFLETLNLSELTLSQENFLSLNDTVLKKNKSITSLDISGNNIKLTEELLRDVLDNSNLIDFKIDTTLENQKKIDALLKRNKVFSQTPASKGFKDFGTLYDINFFFANKGKRENYFDNNDQNKKFKK